MPFTAPIPFAEALQSRDVRAILPTNLSSAQLAEIHGAITERSVVSAKVDSAFYLQSLDDTLRDLIEGKIDLATGRLRLQESLREIGYVASPDEAGLITDFASDQRTNLVLETGADMASGYGSFIQGQDPAILDQFPAQELYRMGPAKVPRNWLAIWVEHGGQVFGARMIARKDSAIWSAISRFGAPYPPFDYGSHMDVRDVDRDTAMQLGIIDRDTQIEPQDRGFNDDLRFEAPALSSALRQALLDSDPRLQFTGDVLAMKAA
jgi:hypothetical protein